MPWIESHAEVGTHWKTHRLMELTGMSKREAVGVLHLLWHFTLQNCWRDGDLSKYSPRILGEFLGENPNDETACAKLISCLHEAGFMKDMIIHDWHDFCGELIRKRLAYNQKGKIKFSEKSRRKSEKSRRISENSRPTLPNHTLPNITIPNNSKRELSEHQKLVEFVGSVYEKHTGQKYNAKDKDYVISADLIKRYGLDAVIEKVTVLAESCAVGDRWFAKEGWADFGIGKVSVHWNSLIKIEKLSEAEKRQAAVIKNLSKRWDKNAVDEIDDPVARDRIKQLIGTALHTTGPAAQ